MAKYIFSIKTCLIWDTIALIRYATMGHQWAKLIRKVGNQWSNISIVSCLLSAPSGAEWTHSLISHLVPICICNALCRWIFTVVLALTVPAIFCVSITCGSFVLGTDRCSDGTERCIQHSEAIISYVFYKALHSSVYFFMLPFHKSLLTHSAFKCISSLDW